jgi:hypothetical protein
MKIGTQENTWTRYPVPKIAKPSHQALSASVPNTEPTIARPSAPHVTMNSTPAHTVEPERSATRPRDTTSTKPISPAIDERKECATDAVSDKGRRKAGGRTPPIHLSCSFRGTTRRASALGKSDYYFTAYTGLLLQAILPAGVTRID